MSDQNFLITAQELAEKLRTKAITLIDTREESEYVNGHIPGAINIREVFTYLVTSDNGGLTKLVETFTDIFTNAGVSMDRPIVIYEDAMDSGYGQSCRGYFLLKYLGHPDVRVLHGGFWSWVQAGHSYVKDLPMIEPGRFTPSLDESIMVSTVQMRGLIDESDTIILDNRDKDEWVGDSSSPYGKDFCPRKGRIPGAIWIEWTELMEQREGITYFLDNEQIRSICQSQGITQDSSICIYCFKGSRASNTYIALKKAGFEDVKIYFPSWNDWSRDATLPIEN